MIPFPVLTLLHYASIASAAGMLGLLAWHYLSGGDA